MFKLVLEKAEEPEIKLPTSLDHRKSKSIPKGHLFGVLVLKGLVGLHRPIQLQFFNATGGGIDLDYCNIEWFALETSRDHSVIFVIASKYCISSYTLVK